MEELDLKELMKELWNKKFVIIIITLIAVIVASIYSMKIQKPKYQAATTLVLTQSASSSDSDAVTSTDVTMNQKLVTTYSEIIKSKSILSQVIDNLELKDISFAELKNNIQVEAVEETEVIKITVTSDNPEDAAKIANEIGKVFSEKIVDMYKINNIYTLDVAETPKSPYNINPKKYIIIAFALGIIISCAIIVVLSLFDNTVKSSAEIERMLDTPVIAQITYYDKIDEKEEGSSSNE